MGGPRLTIQNYHDLASKRGGRCLATEHINCKIKVLWECQNDHKWSAAYSPIKNGSWCPYCAGLAPKTILDCHELAKINGGRCLSAEYVNAYTKLYWECDKNHKWYAAYNHIQQGRWCHYCAGNVPNTIEDCHALAKLRGGKCLSPSYFNCMRKITWECDKNHTWLAKYNSIKNGQWCPFCAGKIKKSIDDCHQLAKSRGGRCLSEKYLNNRTNLYWECGVNTDHKWFATYHSIKSSGTWCPYCAADKKTSRGEQELADFVQGFVRVIRNNRTVIGPYELDIWVPDLQIGIEYDGGYWHDLPEMMERDALKDKMCQEAGILLLRVTDKNWDKDRDQTKIEILQFLLEAASPKVSSSP